MHTHVLQHTHMLMHTHSCIYMQTHMQVYNPNTDNLKMGQQRQLSTNALYTQAQHAHTHTHTRMHTHTHTHTRKRTHTQSVLRTHLVPFKDTVLNWQLIEERLKLHTTNNSVHLPVP